MAKRRPPKSRLNLRIPKPLLMWAKSKAYKSNTTVTQIVIDLMTTAKEAELRPITLRLTKQAIPSEWELEESVDDH